MVGFDTLTNTHHAGGGYITALDTSVQSGCLVKAYEYYQTCIATKTFEFFGFLSEVRNDTPNGRSYGL